MPSVAHCSRCERTYIVIGPPSPGQRDVWICPRCKRGRNLPLDAGRENPGVVSGPPRVTALQ